jgi:hypothetical protein
VGDTICAVRVVDGNGGSASGKFNIQVIHTNHAPSTFNLLLPKNQDTLQLHNPPLPVTFKWNSSKDIDINDSLRYEFKMSGPGLDTLVAGIKDTSLSLNLMSSMKKQSTYNWNVRATDFRVWTASADSFYFYTSSTIVGIENTKNRIPVEYSLSQNYPNPFSARGGSASGGNPSTTINYSLPKPGYVSLKVYNILGEEVAVIVNEEKEAGYYCLKFPANNIHLSSGIYIYQMKAGDFTSIKKLVLLK